MVRGTIAVALLLVALAAMSWTQTSDPDADFHIASGREILALHHVPATNTLGYTEPDAPWGSYQWLGSVVIYLAWRAGGAAGLTAMKCVTVVAIFAFLVAFARRERWPGATRFGDAPGALAAGLVIFGLAAWAARPRFVERPLLFSALFEAMLLWMLAGYETRPPRRLLWLVPLFVVWWNVHAGFIYGILILAAFIAGDLVEPGRRAGAIRLAAASGAAVAGAALVTLAVNPRGLHALAFPLEMYRSPLFSAIIDEFRRTSLRASPEFTVLLVLAPAVMALAWALGRRPRIAHMLLVAGFAWLAASRVRMVLDMAVVTAPLAAGYLACILARVEPRGIPRRTARWAPVAAGLLVLAVTAWRVPRSIEFRPGSGFDTRTHPDAALDFIAAENLPGEVFTADMWSGAFLRRFHPARRVFIHNQLEVYREPFWRDVYLPLLAADPGWKETLRRYDVNTLLLRYSGDRYRQRIADALFGEPGWTLVYWDDLALVYVRNTPAAAGVIDKHALRAVNPEHPDLARLVASGGGPAAEAELLGVVAAEPRCRRAWSFLAETRLEMGKIAGGEEGYRRLLALAELPGERAAALAGLARARWMSGEHAAAESLYTAALEARPDDPYLLARRARTRLETGDIEGARSDAHRTLGSRGAAPADLVYLGEAFADGGKGDEAQALFERAEGLVTDRGERAHILQRSAIAWERAKDATRAEAAYRAAMSADPRWADPPNNLAWLLLDHGRRDEALVLARAAVGLSPKDGYAWGTLARGLFESGQVDSSVTAYERAVAFIGIGDDLARGTTEIGLARAYAAVHRREDAIRQLDAAQARGLSPELRAAADSVRSSMGDRR